MTLYTMGGSIVSSGGSLVSTTAVILTTASLPAATVGSTYSTTLTVTGGTGTGYSVYIQQAVPNSSRWLQMTGVLTLGGIPQAAETSQVTLVACDSVGNTSAPVTLSLTSTASGGLAFVTGATLENSTSGGIFARPIIVQGGIPPYIHASADQVQPWALNWDGWILGAPTSAGSVTVTDTVTDSAGSSVSRGFSMTVGSGIGISGLDLATNQINLPPGVSGNKFQYSFWAFGGIGSGYSCSVIAGALAPGLTLTTLKITGTPTRAGSFFATVQVSDGTHTASYAVCHQIAATDTANRPSYNTGTGLFVANGKLYDSGGKVVALRGLDRVHYDSSSWASGANGAKMGSNAVRVFEFDVRTAAQALTDCNGEYLPPTSGNTIVPILTLVSVSGTNTSGSTSTTLLTSAIAEWVSYYSTLSSLDGKVIYNLANEWGPGASSSVWTNAYISAVSSMRAAGYLGPLLIDAGGSGQDWQGLIANAQAVQQSDPQQNCIFSYHAYGSALNEECTIASVTRANPAVITLNSNLPFHPMGSAAQGYPVFSSNNATGNLSYVISGAQGMTQLNGSQPCTANNIGGTQGAWTITLSVDSTSWGVYTGGGSIVMPNDYRQICSQLAALRANNVCVGIFEFGPGNSTGSPMIAFNGYISGTTLTVTSMISGNILPSSIGTNGIAVNGLTSANGASPSVSSGTLILSQSSGTTGGTGAYVVNNSQSIGSAGSPVKLFQQSQFGNVNSWFSAATGPSPTNTSLGQIVSGCEANLLPWAYWAVDDHDIGANQECSWIGWFGTENAGTNFAVPSDLTAAGMDVVFNPRWGIRTLATPASYLL